MSDNLHKDISIIVFLMYNYIRKGEYMRVIISAGGTGGHIYPALAIIDKLKKEEKTLELLYIGTHNRMEKDIIPSLDIPYISLEVYGYNKKEIIRNFKNIYLINKAYRQCLNIIKEFKPDIVIGVGGYVTYPVMKAAKKLGIKTFLHEQNSIPGKANLAISRNIDVVGVSFKESIPYFKNAKRIEMTGNPCGERALSLKPYSKKKLGLSVTKKLVVIVSGSLGSHTINAKMKEYLYAIDSEKYEVLYITGANYYEEFIKNESFPSNVIVIPYLDNLASLLKKTDLLVTRAGASTISEILALELPSILIPSPYVANNHQYYNALEIANNDAGVIITEEELSKDKLQGEISKILYDSKRYQTIKTNLKNLGGKNSSQVIYKIIKELVDEKI